MPLPFRQHGAPGAWTAPGGSWGPGEDRLESEDGRRARGDRRGAPTPRFSVYALARGRRRRVRRDAEREGSFVDRHGWRVVGLLLWVAVLNVGDSFFTLLHLQNGGVELNPVAAAMLRSGRLGFVLWKSVMIALPLTILCVHKNFPLARLGLWTAAATYTALLGYHLYLL